MKVLLILSAVIFASYAEDIEYFKTADDYFDMETVVNDKVKLQEYVDCFLGRKACEPLPASYLMIIPEAVRTACKRCNPAQKHLGKVFLSGLYNSLPEEFDNYFKKFDPEGKFKDEFLDSLRPF